MSNLEKQMTAAGDALRPAAVAMAKCPPSIDRNTQAHQHAGLAEASETGDIPEIIGNDRGLYEGDLTFSDPLVLRITVLGPSNSSPRIPRDYPE
jgi:hypothetical protein